MPDKKRPLNDTAPIPSPESLINSEGKTSCPEEHQLSEFLSEHKDVLSHLLKDALTSSSRSDFFKYLLRDEFDNTPETIIWFLKLAQEHSKENSKLV
ncbi:hypothetical protein [uncultured Victivallis sp.]|uniref:hypothetical protein n=1 Tax=uncultured Victivallis sp. TaxID=354118 RepID=UPI00258BC6F0|nr:hypothetical protein [uncultured Victivallis sp.]